MGLLEDLNFGNIDEEKPTEPGGCKLEALVMKRYT